MCFDVVSLYIVIFLSVITVADMPQAGFLSGLTMRYMRNSRERDMDLERMESVKSGYLAPVPVYFFACS